MTLTDHIAIYFITFAAFIAVDAIWLGKIAPKMYREKIGHLMAKKANLKAAAAFYALYMVGLIAFVVIPALNANEFTDVLIYGPLFGLVTYGTFDLTSQAVFKNWPTKITLIDLAWGTFLGTAVSALAYVVADGLVL